MSFVLTEFREGHTIEVTVSDKLTKDIFRAFQSQAEATIEKYGNARVLFVLLGFRGWDVGDLWDDVPYDEKNFDRIERLAIVGESKWKCGMSEFCRPFMTALIRYYEQNEIDEARKWVRD